MSLGLSSGSVQDGEMKTLMKLEDLGIDGPTGGLPFRYPGGGFFCTQRQGRLLPVDADNVGQIQLSDFAAARQRHCHTLPIASDSLRCLVDEDQRLFPATGHPTDWPIP